MKTAAKCGFLLLSLFFISTVARAGFIPVYDAASTSPYVIAYVPIIHEPTAIIALNSQTEKNGDGGHGDDGNADDGSYKPPASDENGLWQPMPGNDGEYVEELSTTEATAATTPSAASESSTNDATSQNSVADATTTASAASTSATECGPDGEDGEDGADGENGPDGSQGGKGGKGGKAGKGGCPGRGGDGGDAGDAPIPPNEQPTKVVINDAIHNIVIE